MTKLFSVAAAAIIVVTAYGSDARAAGGGGPEFDRQKWSFAGMRGYFDNAQLQRGFRVYQEVCAACHGMKRLSFRNLTERGGPEFPEDGVKSLASAWQNQIPEANEQGETHVKGRQLTRAPKLTDPILGPYANEAAARAANNGALPPDLSIMAKARGIEVERPFYAVPFGMVKDIATGYQEAGPDYIYAVLTGYKDKAPAMGTDGKPFKLSEGMNYNTHFPGYQIAMANPLSDGLVKYTDGTPTKVANYAADVSAFMAWAADPKLEERKRIGLMAMLYLLLTALLLYFAKKSVWSKLKH